MAYAGIEVKIKRDRTKIIAKNTSAGAKKAMTDIVDNLARASSMSAPHDKGVLEDSYTKEVGYENARLFGTVSYSVKAKGGYNYAVKMHESNYNLGEGSRGKSGGTGLSGKKYPVGKHFLSGVLEGERQAYVKHIDDGIKNQLK